MKTLSTAIETQINNGINMDTPLHEMVRLYHFMFAFEGQLSLKALKEVTGLHHHFCKVNEEQRLAILALIDTVSSTQEDMESTETEEKQEEENMEKILYIKSTSQFHALPDEGAWNRGNKLPETQLFLSQLRKQLVSFKDKGYTKIVFENRLGCGLLVPLASKDLGFDLIAIESDYGYKGLAMGTRVLKERRKEFFLQARKASSQVRFFETERDIFKWVQSACDGVLLITSSQCKDKGVMKAHHHFFQDHKVINLDKVRQEVNALCQKGWLSSLSPLFPRHQKAVESIEESAKPVQQERPVLETQPDPEKMAVEVTDEELAGLF